MKEDPVMEAPRTQSNWDPDVGSVAIDLHFGVRLEKCQTQNARTT